MGEVIATIAIWAIPVLLAITLHEAAHGYAARILGDPTAARMGRISLNPIRHIDPVGTVAVPLLLLVLSMGMGGTALLFGWAKPVPVNPQRLRDPKRDMMWVAAAGPTANFLQAIGWAAVYKLAFLEGASGAWAALARMGDAGIHINLMLMLINLLPILPLDGGRILVALLPTRAADFLARLEPYGMVILLLLLAAGLLSPLLWPFYVGLRQGLLAAVGA
ncbi:MAG: site-2 protease family protein [Hydrogenophilus sp.]|nr:site-2 protease family protein [Hydrogenophilus sp.]